MPLTIKNHVINIVKQLVRGMGESILIYQNANEDLNKLKSKGFLESSVTRYYFSTLYTTLLHNQIKEKLTVIIEVTFNEVSYLY